MSEKSSGTDQFIGFMILAAVFAALALLVWYFMQFEIKNVIRWIRYGWMWLASLWLPDDYIVEWKGHGAVFKEWLKATPHVASKRLSNELIGQMTVIALTPWRWFITSFMVIAGIWVLFKGPTTNNRRKLNLDGLISAQAPAFPYIVPFIDFNPADQPPRPPGSPVPAELPPFAEALAPEEWLAFHAIPIPDGKIDTETAAKAFAYQLGKPWRGPMSLPTYKQVLLAAFCLKAARKRTQSDDMLGQLAISWSHKKGLRMPIKLVREARKVLKDKNLSGGTITKCNQHAYENTAMLRGLAAAREEGGVLAPASFVWLRGYDRDLWYALNNLGRQAFHMEGFGAMAHYKAERQTQRPILRPKVEDAVKSIVDYMSSNRARPIPPLDYSKSKKRRAIKKPKAA